MNGVLSVGVIGCGEIAQIAHIPYLKELPNFEVGAICDISQNVIEGVGEQFGVEKRYLDFHDMLAQPDLDAVLVSNKHHAEAVIAAAKAGKHIMVEKPLAFNLRQADQMIAEARKNNIKLMVAYMKRYDPAYEWALTVFNDMGDVHLIRVHDFGGSYKINQEIYDLIKPTDLPADFIKAAQDKETADMIEAIGAERSDAVEAYGLLLYNGSHDANILQEAFGPPKKILYAAIHDQLFVTAVLDYGDNTRCVWELGQTLALSDWDEQLVVYGSRRRVTVRFPFPYLKNAATQVVINEVEEGKIIDKKITVSFDEAFKREWRHFYKCVTEDKTPITSGEKGRADLELLINLIKTAQPS